MSSTIYTIGFTGTTAEGFFERLKKAGVKKLIDVRLNNTSQLSGFAKASDLPFFLQEIANIKYAHLPALAPTESMLRDYKKLKGAWVAYEADFLNLMLERRVETLLMPEDLDGTCLLCSEAKPHHCHRRLVCDYLNSKWSDRLSVRHL